MSRTSIVLDDKLVQKAIQITGAKSKSEAVDMALRKLVRNTSLRQTFLKLGGKLHWEGDLGQMRKNRV